jgi:SAM-dependent methyltransferase
LSSQEPWWAYEQLESRAGGSWSPATRGDSPWDALDFHLDIGCGTVPKGRLGIDRFGAPEVGMLIDLDKGRPALDYDGKFAEAEKRTFALYEEMGRDCTGAEYEGLPFPDNSIRGIITHHCLEHLRDGFIPLMDEMHRVMEPGSFLRIIVPLFPSKTAVEDPDHKRYFMENSFETFCGAPDGSHWMESFSVPYTSCRFEMASKDFTAMLDPASRWGFDDAREMRLTLRKWPETEEN